MEQLSERLYDTLTTFLLKLRQIPKKYYLPIGISLIGLVFLSIGLIQFSGSKKIEVLPVVDTLKATGSASLGLIKVDVEGGVVNPGVYELSSTSRIQDALVAAGGLSALANRIIIQQRINLAAKVTDGMKIYIPTQKDAAGTSGTADYSGDTVRLVDINSATASELDSIPGIGMVTAQKIIANRPYGSVDELLSKKVVSNSIYQKIKDAVTAY